MSSGSKTHTTVSIYDRVFLRSEGTGPTEHCSERVLCLLSVDTGVLSHYLQIEINMFELK
jgi:hypothetical protein